MTHEADPVAARLAGPADESLPTLVGEVYRVAPVRLRAQVLECLLRPVGPLALAALAAGAFGAFLQRHRWSELSVSIDDTAAISGDQLTELARYVEQASPEVFWQLAALLTQHPAAMAGGGALLLLTLRERLLSRLRGTPPA